MARRNAADFETAVRRADDLVDRREAEAQRVATAAELRAAEMGTEGRLALDRQALAGAEAELRSVGDEWTGLWAPSGVTSGTPAGAMAWLASKDEALRSIAASREASDRCRRAGACAVRARALHARAAALLGLPPDGPMDEGSNTRTARLRSALADRRVLWSRATKRDEAERALADLFRADAARLEDWTALAARLGWRVDATVAEAEAVLQNWEGMATPLSDRENARRRLVDLRKDNRAFRSLVAEVEVVLAGLAVRPGDGAAGSPEAIVRRLEEGLSAEKVALTRHREAKRAVETATREL